MKKKIIFVIMLAIFVWHLKSVVDDIRTNQRIRSKFDEMTDTTDCSLRYLSISIFIMSGVLASVGMSSIIIIVMMMLHYEFIMERIKKILEGKQK